LLLYYITDRTQFPGNEADRRRALLAKIAETTWCGVDYIQLREKDLSTRELEKLALEAVALVRENHRLRTGNRELRTRLLINSRTDVAIAVGADGVHLRSDDVSPSTARSIWQGALARGSELETRSPIIAVSCHTPAEVHRAVCEHADFATFAAVFGKHDRPQVRPTGLDMLREACHAGIQVLGLGGVTMENAGACIQAGAVGIAGIRLFQENDASIIGAALRQITG